MYRTFHPKVEYIFFSSTHETFFRIDHVKPQHNMFKKTEIISSIFPGIKLEINYKNKTGKFTNVWRLNNMLLSNQWVKGEIKRETKK